MSECEWINSDSYQRTQILVAKHQEKMLKEHTPHWKLSDYGSGLVHKSHEGKQGPTYQLQESDFSLLLQEKRG